MSDQSRKTKQLIERFYEDPDDVLIEKLLEVIDETNDTRTKFESIKMIKEIKTDYVC